MKFHNRHRQNIKRYRKIKAFEYAIIFDNSNSLIDYICSVKTSNIIKSSLYATIGNYQLVILSNSIQNPSESKNIIFKDKLHLYEIKTKSRLICKNNALLKLQKAFKEL